MAFSIDWTTSPPTITVPQSDLVLLSGTLYEHDTQSFWEEIKALEASEEGIVFDDLQFRSPPVTVAGTIFAPVVALSGRAKVRYEDPASFYSVRLVGTNNDIWSEGDGVFIPHSNVAVAPTNSAGLVIAETGTSGLTPAESQALLDIADDVAAARAEVFALSNTNASLVVEVGDLGDTMDTVESLVYALNNNAASLTSEVSDLGDDITGLETIIYTLSNNNASLTVEISNLSANVAGTNTDLSLLRMILQNRKETDPVSGVLTIYADDDVTPLFTAAIFENVAGTVPYKGQGLERQNRLT